MIINLPLLCDEGMGETQGKEPQELCNLKENVNYALDSGFSFRLRKKKKEGSKAIKQEVQTAGLWSTIDGTECTLHSSLNTECWHGKNPGM